MFKIKEEIEQESKTLSNIKEEIKKLSELRGSLLLQNEKVKKSTDKLIEDAKERDKVLKERENKVKLREQKLLVSEEDKFNKLNQIKSKLENDISLLRKEIETLKTNFSSQRTEYIRKLKALDFIDDEIKQRTEQLNQLNIQYTNKLEISTKRIAELETELSVVMNKLSAANKKLIEEQHKVRLPQENIKAQERKIRIMLDDVSILHARELNKLRTKHNKN